MNEEMASRIRKMEQIDLAGLTEKAKVAIEAYVKGLEMGMEIKAKETEGGAA